MADDEQHVYENECNTNFCRPSQSRKKKRHSSTHSSRSRGYSGPYHPLSLPHGAQSISYYPLPGNTVSSQVPMILVPQENETGAAITCWDYLMWTLAILACFCGLILGLIPIILAGKGASRYLLTLC